MQAIHETLARAKAYHQAGDLETAELFYERVLQLDSENVEAHALRATACHGLGRLNEAIASLANAVRLRPDFPDAHNHLGVLLAQQGRLDEAVTCFEQAFRLRPDSAEIFTNLRQALGAKQNSLGNGLAARGKLDEAEACYRRALELKPDYPEAHNNLGMVLADQGKLREALNSYRRALELKPEFAEAHNNLGAALATRKELEEAAACIRRALELRPDYAKAHHNLGAVFAQQQKLDEAAACCRRALQLMPDLADAYNTLAVIFRDQSKLDEASRYCRRALELRPGFGEAHANLGDILAKQKQFADAATCYRRAIALKSEFAHAHNNLGIALRELRQTDEAIECYRRALNLKPDFAEAHNNLGVALADHEQAQEAAACCRRALEINPDYADAHNNLGAVLSKQAKLAEAMACFRRALELRPDFADALDNLGGALKTQGKLDEAADCYRQALCFKPDAVSIHSNLVYLLNFHPGYGPEKVFAEHRMWAARHADALLLRAAPHTNDPAPSRRLRLGYVSGHFRSHAVNFFSEPILAAHDHSAVEVFCYSNVSRPHCDATTERLRTFADHWRDVADCGDDEVCEAVRADRIDILVDLSGHIGGNRLLLFARKPAPVQVTYIGYQNTTGMLAMDYRLTDAWADPPGVTDRWYTEKLVRLPQSFFCYRPPDDAPALTPLPALENAAITFGSFNNFAKVTPAVLATWAEIMVSVSKSRLIILAHESVRQDVCRAMARAGVSAERIGFFDYLPRTEYLELIQSVDIALDPFPFNGHTTTCDCLWMGVPVVALAGQTYASRFGTSVLVNVGLRNLIAETREQYVRTAKCLASDIERMVQYRANLRSTMLESPLLDAQTFTRNLEAAYRQMWCDWCARQ